jgi:predicted aminopeptidase
MLRLEMVSSQGILGGRRRVLARAAVALGIVALGGCASVGYYLQAIDGHGQLVHRARPMDALIADSEVPEGVRERLRRVQRIREFATQELSLPDNGSYRSYAPLDRSAVVWSVMATAEFGVEPVQWCYPIIGCASYRGYFAEGRAEREAARLRDQGRDVSVDPVAAYSTLGWFADPLPSTVLGWPEPRLAGLIFHELAHQQVYAKGDSAFNESFATAVQRAGVRRWLTRQRDETALHAWERQLDREQAFTALLGDTRRRLAELYRQPFEAAALRSAKRAEFERLQRSYRALSAQWEDADGFDSWMARPLNNARLALVGTYEAWVPAMQVLLCRADGELPAFYRAAQELADMADEARRRELERLSTVAGQGSALRRCE